MHRCIGAVLFTCCFYCQAMQARADDGLPVSYDLHIDSSLAEVGATLLIPHAHDKIPCVVIIGGTMSHDRNGKMIRDGVPQRDALLRWAREMAAGGYASLRYDRVESGESRPKETWTRTYASEAQVARDVLEYARSRPEFDSVALLGESAGAYLACMLARDKVQADAYLFLGALCSPAETLYEHNFGRLVTYLDGLPKLPSWAKDKLDYEIAMGRHYHEMFEAAAEGENEFALQDGKFKVKLWLSRRREELDLAPDKLFRHIQAPALALAGEFDRNVPPEDAAKAEQIMRVHGNQNARSQVIAGADHSFQEVPANEADQIQERYTFASFERPYLHEAYDQALAWLHEVLPTKAEFHDDHDGNESDHDAAHPPETVVVDPKTDSTPRRVQLARGVELIEDITDPEQTAGVETLEGRIGPLLLAEGCQAHFIEMHAGMYVKEHAHSTESIIYTVRGRWVLCSDGHRHLMKPGTLFRFGKNVSTGYEVPFGEDACILIFKGDRTTKRESEFTEYLQGMADKLRQEHADGTPFLLKELPAEHPARKFAQQVNPEFESQSEATPSKEDEAAEVNSTE